MPKQTLAAYYGKDHDRLGEIFRTFQALKRTDFNRAKMAFSEFRTDLQKHFACEEEIIFPLIEAKTSLHSGGPTTVLRMEHQEILEILERIYQKVDRADLNSDVDEQKLLTILEKHNTQEKNFLYSLMDWGMSDEERDSVFDKMKKLAGGQ